MLAADATHPPPGQPCGLVFLDPPYGRALVPAAATALAAAGWLAAGALLVAETGRDEPPPWPDPLAERLYGAARVSFRRWRPPPETLATRT